MSSMSYIKNKDIINLELLIPKFDSLASKIDNFYKSFY